MYATTEPSIRPRLTYLDALRGLAVALMILDHTIATTAIGGDYTIRHTITRLSLPAFCFAAAGTYTGRQSPRRLVQLLGVILLAEIPLNGALGLGLPGPVFLLVLTATAACVFPTIAQRPVLFGTLGLLQALYLPVAVTGYQPGLVLLWWCLGRLGWHELSTYARRLPAWLEPIGRRPLTWYVGHLLVLTVLAGST